MLPVASSHTAYLQELGLSNAPTPDEMKAKIDELEREVEFYDHSVEKTYQEVLAVSERINALESQNDELSRTLRSRCDLLRDCCYSLKASCLWITSRLTFFFEGRNIHEMRKANTLLIHTLTIEEDKLQERRNKGCNISAHKKLAVNYLRIKMDRESEW